MFRFKLQQVLDYREQLRDQAQIELARILTEYYYEEARIQDFENLMNENMQKLHDLDPNAYNERWLMDQCIKGLRVDLSKAWQRLGKLKAAAEAAQKKLAHFAKEHKVLEKLKEKQSKQYEQKEKADEQRNYDEISSMRYTPPTY